MSKHLVIPDCQVKPGVPLEHLEWLGKYIVAKKPDVVIQIGDFADMESLSSYDEGKKSFEGRRYKNDINVARLGMEKLLGPLQSFNKGKSKNSRERYQPRLVLTLGNHEDRITRAIESDAKLEGVLSLKDLGYEEFGWEVSPYLQPVKIGGILYNHYFPSGPKGHPCSSARSILNKYHTSCFAGHQQGRDIAYARKGYDETITSIICGSFYLHEEEYLNPCTNRHWRGIYVLHEVKNGSFDEMPVSLKYLKKKYGGK